MKTVFSLLILLLGAYTLKLQAQSTDPPNFIFIVLDDLNDFVGYLEGHPQISTPGMDRLSAAGVSFTNAYANSPLCAPSRTSFLTGKSTEYTGIFENDAYNGAINNGTGKFRALFDSTQQIITLPEYLKDSAGYYTLGLGKVFNGWYSFTKNDNDFDSLTADPCAKKLSWSELKDYPTSPTAVPLDSVDPFFHGVPTFRFASIPNSLESEMEDVAMMDQALSFLDNYQADPSGYCDRPFFLAVGLHKPHAPRFIPERYFSDFYQPDLTTVPYDIPYNIPKNAWPPNGDVPIPQPDTPYADYYNLGPFGQLFAMGVGGDAQFDSFPYQIDPVPIIDPLLDPLDRNRIISDSKRALYTMAYNASVSFADYQIYRLLDKLQSLPSLKENTVIVLISDHGHGMGEKRHWRKGALWDTDLHVPLIVVDPRKSIAGQQNASAVSLLDIYPTFCELAGIPAPKTADGSVYLEGRSLVDLIEDPSIHWNSTVASSVSLPLSSPVCHNPLYSIYSDEFHYIRYHWGFDPSCNPDSLMLEEELYHIGINRDRDPNEWNNLAYDPAYRQVKNYLSSHLPGQAFSLAYSRPLPGLEIVSEELPCEWTLGDSLQVQVQWLNPMGEPVGISPDENFQLSWFVNGDTLAIGDSSLTLVPMPDSLGRWILELSLSDTVGRIFALDRLDLNLAPIDPHFNLNHIDSALVSVHSLATLDAGVKHTWNWGDLTVLKEEAPAPHLYRSPGTYTVSHQIQSLNQAYDHCSWSYDTTFSLAPADFGGTCMTPLPPNILLISADRFKMNWSNVFNATSYNVRFKKSGYQFTNWFSGNIVDTVVIAGPLAGGGQWDVAIQAVCSSDTSAWSWSTLFENPFCNPPSAPQPLLVTSDSIHFDWQRSVDATLGYDILLRETGVPARYFSASPAENFFKIGDLTPSTSYNLYMRSRCPQIIPSIAYKPSKPVLTLFATPATIESEVNRPETNGTETNGTETSETETASTSGDLQLLLTPNPASGTVVVSNLPEQISSDMSLVVISSKGRELYRTSISPEATTVLISAEKLLPGTYLVQVVEAGKVRNSAILVRQ